MKIRVDVTCYNRKKITELCLLNLKKYNPNIHLRIYDDNSEDYNHEWLCPKGDSIRSYDMSTLEYGWQHIHLIRSKAFYEFLNEDFDFLYLTDNDALHDPNWLTEATSLYNHFKLPVCLYISSYMYNHSPYYKAQVDLKNSIIRGVTGGISMFLSRSHVNDIVQRLNGNMIKDQWDCQVWNMLGNKFMIPKNSMVEHFGKDGLHHKDFNSEYAINPSIYLKNIKKHVIDYLDNDINFNYNLI